MTAMNGILGVLLMVAMLAVLGILVTGIVGFARGGEFDRKHSNKIMNLRVLAQFVVVILFAVIFLIDKLSS